MLLLRLQRREENSNYLYFREFSLKIDFMKKIFLLLGILFLMGGGLFGCGQDEIVVDSLVISDENASKISIAPDYEKRILAVTYTGNLNEIENTGDVGGEFFERFEEVSKIVSEWHVGMVSNNDGPVFISMDGPEYYIYWDYDLEGLEEVKVFYENLDSLFNADVY